jgi:hypothetical protein
MQKNDNILQELTKILKANNLNNDVENAFLANSNSTAPRGTFTPTQHL